ncbi:Asparaginase/glutaminase [Crenothrix polyspora]|uniref:Asparaginase/glutaminase n=1 Tax=Crenothrix polyspora TaxID=360316 RepID=A0A1R4HCT9_9GAMM|nr:asparaginase [Crenothrix polyspora]SJM94058.1 Asparaginase/glutaminase [Crenothrix polyspora]
MTKHILVVFTGGTIGSTATEGTINTSHSAPYQLIQLFQQHYPNHQHITFTGIQPLQLLSENLATPAWTTLMTAIESAHPENYDGIIITHGTDTLSFTAAALSFYFHALKKPMLLVSSNYPLDNPKANGLDNFICAVEFVLQVNEPGIFVPYRNPKQTMHLHRGVHLAASLQLSGDFFSVQGKHYMQFAENRFSIIHPKITTPTISVPLKPVFSNQILLIKPYPGLNYANLCLEHAIAVLHDLYHSGTACATQQWGDDYSLSEFIKRCFARNIPVYMAPAIKTDDAYQSTRALLELGANMLWNMSLEAAYVKLSLAYGNFTDDGQIADFLAQNIALECVN